MPIFHQSFVNLFTFALPVFCLLLSWASSTATPPPPPPSAMAASETLRDRGYSLFAGIIAATDTALWNGTGTILAPPDFAFSFATAKFTTHGRAPPRPSTSLLLYHTLKQPLTYHNLTARANSDELLTFYQSYCVFVSKNANGELSFAETKKPIATVKIRQPDLYVDDYLTVHGVDGVMDPTSASKCSFPDYAVQIESQVDRSFLDHAVKVLRRRGFGVVATAMEMRQPDLMSLTAITVFAPSDARLFSASNGIRFDFHHHVILKRLSFADLARLPVGTEIETVDPNRTVVIGSVNGAVTVNGVTIDGSEVYHNRWVSAISISRSLDDDSNFAGVLSPAPTYSGDAQVKSLFPGGHSDFEHTEVRSPAPSFSGGSSDFGPFGRVRTPSPAPNHYGDAKSDVGEDARRPPFTVPAESASTDLNSLAPSFSSGISDFRRVGTPSPVPNHYGKAKSNVGEEIVTEVTRRPPSPSPAESASTDLNSSAPSFSGRNPMSSQFSGGFSDFGRVGTPSPVPNHHGEAKSNVREHTVTEVTSRLLSPSPAESASTDLNSSAPGFSGGNPASSQFSDGISDFGRIGTPPPAPNHHGEGNWNVAEGAVTKDTRRPPSPPPVESASTDLNSSPADLPGCSDGVVSSLSLNVEGQDLFCPLTVETKVASGVEAGNLHRSL